MLRLQIANERLEGLLQFTLPAGRDAERLLAAPPGLALGDPVAAQALRGLHLSVGPDETALRPAPLKLVEAKARRTRTGGIDAMLLVSIEQRLSIPSIVELSVTEGPRVRATLGAAAGVELSLLAGVGKPVQGGLALRPRAGKPCRVRIQQRK